MRCEPTPVESKEPSVATRNTKSQTLLIYLPGKVTGSLRLSWSSFVRVRRKEQIQHVVFPIGQGPLHHLAQFKRALGRYGFHDCLVHGGAFAIRLALTIGLHQKKGE